VLNKNEMKPTRIFPW